MALMGSEDLQNLLKFAYTLCSSALSLTHDLLCVLSLDTRWNFVHEPGALL